MIEQLRAELAMPNERDARQVMEWRNDPTTLEMSFHSSAKQWPAFLKEFQDDYFLFPDLPPVFVLVDGQRAGFLRFTPSLHPLGYFRKCCSVGINIAPNFRKKGLGTASLKWAISWIKQQGYEDLYAEVKLQNILSIKAFSDAGFDRLSDSVHVLEEDGTTVPIARFISPLSTPIQKKGIFIIAEAGSNWKSTSKKKDKEQAFRLIDAAVEAQANAVKFQVFRPETIYVPNAGQSDYLAEAGIKKDIVEIYRDLIMPYEMIAELSAYCEKQGIEFMASAFSPQDFAAIDPYVKRHKIASYELGHIRLIELAALSKKPTFISTGAATEEEMEWAVNQFKSLNGGPLTLMQCTAKYPASLESLNLAAMPWMKLRYRCNIGFSDHSADPLAAPLAAAALGITAYEKHFTLDRSLPGPDHAFAVNPQELKALVSEVRKVEKVLGQPIKTIDNSEEELRSFCCRGIQAIQNIRKGEEFHENFNVAILRPGKQIKGIHSRYLPEIEGKEASRDIWLGEGLQFGDWN